jgi:hypothetical protein
MKYLERTGWVLVMLALMWGSTAQAKLYRWVDDDGNVFYSDKVPPSQSKKERAVLDKHGMKVEVVEEAKSEQELKLEHQRKMELERLRREQQRLIAEQEAKDRILLRTFSSEEDITLARDNRLNALDVSIQILKSNVQRAKNQLAFLQKDAANKERQGQKVDKGLREDIERYRNKLKVHYGDIIAKEQEKEEIFASYGKDMERFRSLKDIQEPVATSDQDEKRLTSMLKNVYTCADATVCDGLWAVAEEFARRHATTRMEIVSESIILSAPPHKPDDISVTISRIEDKKSGDLMLFMDLQCATSPTGREFCQSEKVRNIRQEFPVLMAVEADKIPSGG